MTTKKNPKKNIFKKIPHKVVEEGESLILTIEALKKNAAADGIILSDIDIAVAIGLNDSQYNAYIENTFAPSDIFESLRMRFGKYLPHSYHTVKMVAKIK